MIGPVVALAAALSGPTAAAEARDTNPGAGKPSSVLSRGGPVLVFRTRKWEEGRKQRSELLACWRREGEFVLTVERRRSPAGADVTFCALGRDETPDPDACVWFKGVPVILDAPSATPAGPRPAASEGLMDGTIVLSSRGREFQFFLEDVLSPTVRAWLRREWEVVDPSLREPLFELLSLSVHVPLGLGLHLQILLPTVPIESVRRYAPGDVTVEPRAAWPCGSSADSDSWGGDPPTATR